MPAIIEMPEEQIELASISNRTISGIVQLLGVGVVRRIAIFRNRVRTEYVSTYSASDGTWAVDVVGGDNDRFRCEFLGTHDNENSIVVDRVVAG